VAPTADALNLKMRREGKKLEIERFFDSAAWRMRLGFQDKMHYNICGGTMKRSLKFALRFANTSKRKQLDRLWEMYREAVNFFVEDEELTGGAHYQDCKLDLGSAFKQAALRQAIGMLKADKSDRPPQLTKPCMTLDQRFIKVEKSHNSFDYWIKISTLEKGHPISVPIRSYDHANKYLRRWNLVNGGRLIRDEWGNWYIQLVFQRKKHVKEVKQAKGLDIGYRKLITDSDGKVYGTKVKALTEKAVRKQQGLRAAKRVREEIRNYIGWTVKQAVDGKADIAIEDLKRLKDNKKGKWSKNINRKFNYWFYALTLKRIRDRAELFGVRCKAVRPEYTSQMCPKCGHTEKANRQGERFKCLRCSFNSDADHVGAMNILSLAFGREAP